jgi:hypothetical protein
MTRNAITAIAESFDALVPAMAADYRAHIHRQIDRLEARHGNVGSIPRRDEGAMSAAAGIRTFMDAAEGEVVRRPSSPLVRNSDRIADFAERQARDVVAAFVQKLERKLGDLDHVEMTRTDGAAFTLTGTLGGRRIRVEQTVVFKASSRGRPFHQFPARIYVDGRFTPEADFQRLAA